LAVDYTFWIPPVIVALAALFIFWRTQVLRTTEKQLSDLYAPLYLYVIRGLPIEGDFWKQMSDPERGQLKNAITTRNYLASPHLLSLIESEIAQVQVEQAFKQQNVCIDFQRRIIEDYKSLRQLYLNSKRWFLPRIDP
jgi:hypothetical protein